MPNDPEWRQVSNFMSIRGTDGFYGVLNYRHLYFSDEGLHWIPAPVETDGILYNDFQRLTLEDGSVYHRIGEDLYFHESDTSWNPVTLSHDFSFYRTAVFDNRIHVAGYTDLGEGEVFVVDSLSPDGSWDSLQLNLANNSPHRIHATETHLVIQFSSGAWVKGGDNAWQWYDWPDWMTGVPVSEIQGRGPFFVQYTGTTGSFENGDFKFLQVFARSADGFTWEAIEGFPTSHQTYFHAYYPWFVKEAWPSDELDYITTDGLVWDRWSNPDFDPMIRQHVKTDGYRVGISGDGFYIHDMGIPPLPEVDVRLTSQVGGLEVNWEPVSGAAYYVIHAQGTGWWRTYKVSGTSVIVEPMDHSSGYDPIQSMTIQAWAVEDNGRPGLTGSQQDSAFISGDLPFPSVPTNLVVDKSWTTRVERTVRFQRTGETALHQVGYSLPGQGTSITPWFFMETNSADLLDHMEGMPTCELIHVWVRGTDGINYSDWEGPVPFMIGPNDLPCPPVNLSVTLQTDPENFLEYFYLTWERSISANNTQIRRVRMAGPDSRTHYIEADHYQARSDNFTFFDTDYAYSLRSEDRAMFSISSSRYSEWTDPVVVRRPPSDAELLVMTLFEWTSLGNGAFQSPRMGVFRYPEEALDWILFEGGRQFCFLSVTEDLDFIGYSKGVVEGWLIASNLHWPWAYSFRHGTWLWIHQSGRFAWDPVQQKWLGL